MHKVADNADGTVRLEATFDNVYGRARDALIVKLYTGDYSMEVSRVRPLEVIRSLARRAFGRPQQARWVAGKATPVVASCSVANDRGFDQAECA